MILKRLIKVSFDLGNKIVKVNISANSDNKALEIAYKYFEKLNPESLIHVSIIKRDLKLIEVK